MLMRVLITCYHFIYTQFFMKMKNLPERYGKATWVMVTGGTEGIGWEFCQQFAAKGFNIIMIARNKENLSRRKSELKETHKNCDVLTISADFTKATDIKFYDNIMSQIGERDISVIINNVGIMMGALDQNSEEEVLNCSIINSVPVTMFTKIFCDKFYERENKFSAIINVGSLFSEFPSFNNSVYSASKAYVKMFTLGESKNHSHRIDMLMAQPGYCQTNMMGGKGNKLFGSFPILGLGMGYSPRVLQAGGLLLRFRFGP